MIKTHVQAQRSTAATRLTWSSDLVLARTLVTQHGVGSLWRGVGVAASACGPAHALMFGTYEHVLTLGGQESAGADRAAVVGAVAGGVSTLAHDLVMVPADTIKRAHAALEAITDSAFHCLSRMLRDGRRLALPLAADDLGDERAVRASLMMMAKERAQAGQPERRYSLTTFLLCGGFSGAFAAALTTPLDVVKTRLRPGPRRRRRGGGGGRGARRAERVHRPLPRFATQPPRSGAAMVCVASSAARRREALMYGPACAISWVARECDRASSTPDFEAQ